MEAPICALVDAMFRLPGKLDALLVCHGHMLPRGAADEISLIKQDLEKMVAILQEHDESRVQDHAMMVMCLTKEARELSYDMEDSVDQYEHAASTRRWILYPRRKKYKTTRCRGNTIRLLPEKLKWRLWMANKIRDFSMRSQEALQRYSLFNHPGVNGIGSSTASTSTRCAPVGISSSTLVSFASWHPTPYGEPVGIIAPLKKLEEWLDKNGEQKLKVVCVVGSGGIGKTTLANELYRRIGGQFECRAFVRTSRKPDVRRLLVSMLSQVRPHQTPHTWKVHNLIADIRTHIQDKRYLIIIDDLWDMQTWDIINRALPDGNLCSGILITTEIEDVALKCCGYDSKYVFTMKPLGHDDSSKLFFNTAFGPKYECPSELNEVANSIIRKCAGLPLAMVIVANILVNQMGKPEQWDYVNKSLGYGLRTNPNSEGMKQVLNLSYNSLPEHLKPCVMYLSIYEEDYIVQKDDMVNQWISEGFIRVTEERDKEEISRSYFDGLISSRMIQPVHVNDNDDVLSCSVHYMVLDFVTHKSIEENFVTSIDHCQTTARLADKVRRLSLHFGNAEAPSPTNMGLSQVRTLAFFGVFKCLPSIMDFGLLQVLILHLWVDDESISFDLTRISELFRLRYFHVTCNATIEVPQTQMRGLQYLETLKIDARVSAVPSDIVHLPALLHLSLPVETNLPSGIACMTTLCTLGYFDLSVNSIENVQSLGELTNLQDLRLTCSTLPSCLKNKMDCMGSILVKLCNLRSLTLEPSSILDSGPSSISISCDGLCSVSSLALLRRFEWLPHICTFSSLPQWIVHLDKLSVLKIGVMELGRNDVDILRGLPALTVLSLYVRTKPAEKIVFNKTGFSALKYFKFTCSVPWVEFETDAMPNLRRLKLGFDAHGADQHVTVPVGIEHLSGLKEISAKIGGADDLDRTAAESALGYAIEMHPAHPICNIQRVDQMFTGKDDNNSRVEEEEHMTMPKRHEVLQKYCRDDAKKIVHSRSMDLVPQPDIPHSDGTAPGASSVVLPSLSRYESQKRRDWNTFLQYLRNHRPPLTLARCSAAHVLEFLRYLDQFGKTKVHAAACPFFGHSVPPVPCPCPLRQAWGSLDALLGRLRTAYEETGGRPENNPFSASTVRLYLREIREQQARSRGVRYEKKTRKRLSPHHPTTAADVHSPHNPTAADVHPACPTFNIQCGMFSGEDDNNSGVQEEELITLQKQYEIMEEGSIEQHVVLPKGTREDAQSRFSAFSGWRTIADKHADSSTHPRSRMGEKTELSSSRRWTTWLKTEALKFKIMEEDSNRRPPVLQNDYLDDANKHAHGRKMLPKWSTQVRMSSLQDVEGHDDGFSWRKYGQKEILGSQHPRGYYRCTYRTTQDCRALKQLQRTDVDPELFDVMYAGNHTCIQGMNSQPQPAHEQSSISMGVKADGSVQGIEKKPPRTPKRIIKARSLEDGFMWRKYGQKEILGARFPRAYFRCAYKHERGCLATRQVQLSHSDPEVYDVVYNGEHTCGESVHSLPHHTSVSTGLMSPATSENMISFTALSSSSSAAGIPFRSPATAAGSQVTHGRVRYISPGTSESQVTHEGVSSSSAAGVRFPTASAGSQVTNEGPSRSTARVRFMSPGASESQVTYEEVSGSTGGFWSWPEEVDSTTNSPKDDIDLNVDFVNETSYSD